MFGWHPLYPTQLPPPEHDSRKGGLPQRLVRHQPLQLLEEVLDEDEARRFRTALSVRCRKRGILLYKTGGSVRSLLRPTAHGWST